MPSILNANFEFQIECSARTQERQAHITHSNVERTQSQVGDMLFTPVEMLASETVDQSDALMTNGEGVAVAGATLSMYEGGALGDRFS